MTLVDLFGTKESLRWAQEIARALLIFAYGIVVVRVAGRRIFGKWAALDVIVSLIIGSNLSRALTGSAPLWGTLAASTVLIAIHWLLGHAVARYSWASLLHEGRALRIAADGKLDDRRRKSHSISEADIGEALRNQGVERVEDVRDVMLEPSGKLTAIKR